MNTQLFEQFKEAFQTTAMTQDAVAQLILLVPDKVDEISEAFPEDSFDSIAERLYYTVTSILLESELEEYITLSVKLGAVVSKGFNTIMEEGIAKIVSIEGAA